MPGGAGAAATVAMRYEGHLQVRRRLVGQPGVARLVGHSCGQGDLHGLAPQLLRLPCVWRPDLLLDHPASFRKGWLAAQLMCIAGPPVPGSAGLYFL